MLCGVAPRRCTHERSQRPGCAAEALAPCAQVMNELPYLVEWITYYHIQGTHPPWHMET